MRLIFRVLMAVVFVFSLNYKLFGNENHEEKSGEEFDIKEVISHHISDNHSWHILEYEDDNGEVHHLSIPLPVILYTNGHIDVFMSSAFHHGQEHVKKGDREYILHHNNIYLANDAAGLSFDEEHEVTNKKPLDFSITKNVVGMLTAAIIILLIFLPIARKYKGKSRAPKGIQAFVEPLIIFIQDNIAKPNIGENKYRRFMPYLLTIFFFIWINNMLGIVPFFPGGANVTGNLLVTFTLASFTLLVILFSGNKNYYKHIFAAPAVPVWLLPIMIPVEIIGVIVKPFALMIRLFANITAGHIVIISLISLIFIFKSLWISPVSIIFVLFMDVMELLVAAIQAYIFTLLSALFIGMAVEEH